MSNLYCQELFLEDVVSVVVYKAGECILSVPPTILIKDLPLPSLSTPILKANISERDSYILMSERPTLKITNTRFPAGNVYTHDLQIPTVLDRITAEDAVNQLQGDDFCIVYQKMDGSSMISYALPNTSAADIEESVSPTLSTNIKLKLLSMSPLINIV